MKLLGRIFFIFLIAVTSLGTGDPAPCEVRAIHVDQQGVKWVATARGLYRYDDLSWTRYTDMDHLPSNQVNALAYETGEFGEVLWVGTRGGVSALAFDTDGVTGSTYYTTAEGLLDDEVLAIAIDSRGGKFFGSASGITSLYEGIMDSIQYAEYYGSMYDSPIRKLEIYGDTLYMAQYGTIGRIVSGVDGITGASRWGEGSNPSYGVSPYSVDIKSILVKGEEIQYYGTDVGVETHSGYDGQENWGLINTDSGLVHNEVISMSEDADGGLWFGTAGGFSHYASGSWTSYTTADGLAGDTVYYIAFDPDGSVWLGTQQGLSRLFEGSFESYLTAVPERTLPSFELQVYHHPRSHEFSLYLTSEVSGDVMIDLFTLDGRQVAHTEIMKSPGEGRLDFQLGNIQLNPGIHLVRLSSSAGIATRKIFIYP